MSQSRLTIIDRNSNEEVKRLDLTKLFSYKVRNSELWRNGFVTGLEKDTVRLNNGRIAIKNFDIIKQNKKATPFLNTTSDVFFYGGWTAFSASITFYILERADNSYYPGSNNYQCTKTALIVSASMGAIGGALKLLTKKKSIQLGDRFVLVIK
jgi:hypothetical protein